MFMPMALAMLSAKTSQSLIFLKMKIRPVWTLSKVTAHFLLCVEYKLRQLDLRIKNNLLLIQILQFTCQNLICLIATIIIPGKITIYYLNDEFINKN